MNPLNAVGRSRQSKRSTWIALAALVAGGFTATLDAQSTSLTLASGLPRTSEQEATRIDEAVLRLRVDPALREITGDATLAVRASRRLERLVLDLDRRFQIDGIDVGGRALPTTRFRNPLGRLEIDLETPLAADRPLAVRIRYRGAPRVAEIAPWDGGFVWSTAPTGEPWIATAVQGEGLRPLLALYRPSAGRAAGGRPARHRAGAARRGGQRRRSRHDREGRLANLPLSARERRTPTPSRSTSARTSHAPGRLQEPLRQHHSAALLAPREPEDGKAKRPVRRVSADAGFLRGDDRPVSVRRREDGGRRDAAPGHGAPDDQRLRQRVQAGRVRLRLAAAARVRARVVRQPADQRELGRHVAARGLRHLHAAALRRSGCTATWPTCARCQRSARRLRNRFPSSRARRSARTTSIFDDHGPGGDIYAKGSLVLHSLRTLLGDRAFFDATRRLVYGRPDPKPGGFRPVTASTRDFHRAVKEATGTDYAWFFDVYFYQAALPELVIERDDAGLDLSWKVANDRPFPMPVEVALNGSVRCSTSPPAVPALPRAATTWWWSIRQASCCVRCPTSTPGRPHRSRASRGGSGRSIRTIPASRAADGLRHSVDPALRPSPNGADFLSRRSLGCAVVALRATGRGGRRGKRGPRRGPRAGRAPDPVHGKATYSRSGAPAGATMPPRATRARSCRSRRGGATMAAPFREE